MYIMDIEVNGPVIRMYVTSSKVKWNHSWGDDWDDRPYEHNAGIVYDQYVDHIIDLYYPYSTQFYEPKDDWNFRGNSPYSKEDFKKRKVPACIMVKAEQDIYGEYHGGNWYNWLVKQSDTVPIYYGDSVEKFIDETRPVYVMKDGEQL